MVKTETVLSLAVITPGRVTYVSDAREDGTRRHVLSVERDLYEELGLPNTITIAIEPGDRLNDEVAVAEGV